MVEKGRREKNLRRVSSLRTYGSWDSRIDVIIRYNRHSILAPLNPDSCVSILDQPSFWIVNQLTIWAEYCNNINNDIRIFVVEKCRLISGAWIFITIMSFLRWLCYRRWRRREISLLFFPGEDIKLASHVGRKKKYALRKGIYLARVKRGGYLKIEKKNANWLLQGRTHISIN